MATWHQMQARKRPGFKLYHETMWSVLYDPPNEMASIMLFATYREAQAYRSRFSPDRSDHTMILRPAKLIWVEVDEARYDEMLNILPPAIWIEYGFMVGEPWDHGPDGRPRFPTFVKLRGHYYEATLPMTVGEFKALDLSTVGRKEEL
jgi:hypothetical protein